MSTIPEQEPSEIIAGDSLKWNRTDLVADYPASQGWTLAYYIQGVAPITINATANGDGFSVAVLAATTAGWGVGDYWITGVVSKGTDRYTVYPRTAIKIKPNLASVTGAYDGRSHAKTVLDAIEAVLVGRASKDQMKYSIGGRSLDRTPIVDLLKLRDRYKDEYAAELKAEKIKNGMGSGNRVLVRFK